MKLGRLVWSKWGAPLALALATVLPAATLNAAPAEPSPPSGSTTDALSPSSLLSGPSLYETGKVGVAPDSAPAPAPTPVPQELPWAGNGEKSIKPVAADLANAPPPRPPEGVIDPARLADELAANFESVDDCRLDVARDRQVSPGKVLADRLLLRLTIEPSGATGPTEVVATTPVDLDVMDCVKAAMSRWTFTRPRGGAVHVERTFAFRKVP
ncbi:MAG TPA: hypothetical protein VHO06_16445 [Polyangia bacterium]|nr:hypothetical protein [Polyangia bacterium]